jgi:1-acyl-sn-glycerol-3-phosphate acyltransferase
VTPPRPQGRLSLPAAGSSAGGPRGAPSAGSLFTDRIDVFVAGASFLARVGIGLFSGVEVVGSLDAIPRRGPLIIAANHSSNADAVVISGWIQPHLGRRIHWLGKKEMLEWPIIGFFARRISIHPLERGAADVEAYRRALAILAEGHVLVVFPEGTRSPTGVLQRGREGLAALALRSGAPILPLGISGTHRLWPRGGWPRFAPRIRLAVGRPFTLADVLPPGLDPREAKRRGTEAVMRRIAVLLPPEQRGPYGESGPAGEPDGGGSGDGSDPGGGDRAEGADGLSGGADGLSGGADGLSGGAVG